MISEDSCTQEYNSLRSELFQLQQRSHDVWRWGLIAIGAVLGATLSILVDIASKPELLLQLTPFVYYICFLLCSFVGGIAVSMGYLIFDIRNALDRLGAYIAVFHDSRINPSTKLGWHMWNRVEKFYDKNRKFPVKVRTTFLKYDGSFGVYVILIFFYVVCLSGFLYAITDANFIVMLGIGMIICIAVWGMLSQFWKIAGIRATTWNHRWTYLSRLPEEKISAVLHKAGLLD